MYNRIYKYLTNNDSLYKKQFGFQKSCSTEHAILDMADTINENLKNDLYTLGMFIHLSIDTVSHATLKFRI